MQPDLAKGDAERHSQTRTELPRLGARTQPLGTGHTGHNKAYLLNHTTIPRMVY